MTTEAKDASHLAPLNWNTEERAALDKTLLEVGQMGIDVYDPPGIEKMVPREAVTEGLDAEIKESREKTLEVHPHANVFTLVIIIGHEGTNQMDRAVLSCDRNQFRSKDDQSIRKHAMDKFMSLSAYIEMPDGAPVVNKSYAALLAMSEVLKSSAAANNDTQVVSLMGMLAYLYPDLDVMYLNFLSSDESIANARYYGMFADIRPTTAPIN